MSLDVLGRNTEEFNEADVWGTTFTEEGETVEGGHSRNSSLGGSGDEGNGEVIDTFNDEFPTVSEDILGETPAPTAYGSMPARMRSFSDVSSKHSKPLAFGTGGRRSSNPQPIFNFIPVPAGNKENSVDAVEVPDPLDPLVSSLPDPPAGFVPPHVYASTYSTYSSRAGSSFLEAYGNGRDVGSVIVGTGRTLKGKDAIKMRTAVLRQTGFLEPETPSSVREAPVAATEAEA